MPYRQLRCIARWLTGPLALSLVSVCLASVARADPPTCYALVFLDEPNESPYYAPSGGTADVQFSTCAHRVEIYGPPSARYFILWTMTLRCLTNLGGHIAYVDTDWAGGSAVADAYGVWRHLADGCGELDGSLSLGAGSYYARGECSFTASFWEDPDHPFGSSAADEKPFGVVTQSPPLPPGGGGGA